MTSLKSDIADPILYRLYYGLMLSDILHKLGLDATKANKQRLHEYHKKEIGCKSIANESHTFVSHFLFLVCVLWAERGIFVRTKEEQPIDILEKPLSQCWKWL